jgi:3-deoxy-7-phosphoheptulonate synthase
MIVVMQAHCSDQAIEHVMQFLDDHGLSGHLSQGVERTVIGVLGAVGPTGTRTSVGGLNPNISEALECLPGVEQVLIVSKPYKLASREFHPLNTVAEVPAPCIADGIARIGGDSVVMMAGPCTVESEKQLMTTAAAVRKEGAVILRGGAFKPSTSPS